jgi:hypothetical protein
MCNTPIVILTPVKNESWILNNFLSICSQFADKIIIADQFSTDDSQVIARKFDKVELVINDQPEYDESYRLKLLYDKAREIIPGRKLIITIDADELLSFDSLQSKFWKSLDSYALGTIFKFEKPDLLFPLNKCIRYREYFPMGFIDDGIQFTGKFIHTNRVPINVDSNVVNVSDVKFLHFARVRHHEYMARQRVYSMIENINGGLKFYQRLRYYSPRLSELDIIEKSVTPESWITGWKEKDIDLYKFETSVHNHFNNRVIAILIEFGSKRFFYDDIWQIDWSIFSQKNNIENSNPIHQIPKYRLFILKVIIEIIRLLYQFKHMMLKFRL